MRERKNNQKISSLVLLGVLVLSTFVAALVVQPAPGASWWNTSWLFRKSMTIDHTKVAGNLTGFPVLVDVTDSDLAGKAQDNGYDIVFTDYSGTKLDHEIEYFNGTSGKLVAWVNVPSLSSVEDTVLYMYYGNPVASNQENPAAVWDSNYRMVQHLSETSGTHYDSTSYGNNGTYYGSQQNATGKIDGANGFVGNLGLSGGDYVDCGNATSLNINDAITVSAWIKPNDQTQWNHITTKGNGEWDIDANRVYQLSIQPTEQVDFIMNSNRTTKAITAMSVPIGAWSYVVGTYDINYIKIYIDGVERASSAYTDLIQNNTVNLRIASRVKGTGNTGAPAYTFDGLIDEVRVSAIPRSQAWIQTEYNNQNSPSTFYTIGSEETSIEVFVNPSAKDVYLGEEFTIDIDLNFAPNLYGYEVWLSFNNTKLNATSIEYRGYLNEPHLVWYQEVNNTGGYVALAASSLRPAPSKTGGSPPPLATIHFDTIAVGTSPLHLYKTELVDDQAMPIPHETSDGEVNVRGRADLVVDSIVIDDKGCSIYANDTYANDTAYYYPVEVTVRNTGTVAANQFHVRLEVYWISGSITEASQEIIVYGLGAGASTTVNFTSLFHPIHTGYYRLTAIVDSQNEVVESNETNNSYSFFDVFVTIVGDINGDREVNILDAVTIALAWNTIPMDPYWNIRADINHDGAVDVLDADRIEIRWRESW